MARIKRWLWPAALGALLAGLVAASLVLVGVRLPVPPIQQLAADGHPVALEPGTPIGQSFVARYGRVVIIEVKLEAPNQPSDRPVLLRLRSSPEAVTDIARTESVGVTADGFYRFEFAPAANRMGERLYFYLEAPAGSALSVVGSLEDAYQEGEALGSAPLRDLAFRVHYGPTLRQRLWGVAVRLAEDKVGPFGTLGIYLGLATLYLALLAALGWRIGSGELPGGESKASP